ncbi:hypothetical protein PLESTB_000320300 [Pleodorina starrii]|uniref:Dilute domain-containing protein n=1 Tax=Pleodorina starrii TaxID=330485 RepID=A0A9W6BD51_9CHLO|nr:hypothetical protein PLESTB_000320300 [Pleodorina starrii]
MWKCCLRPPTGPIKRSTRVLPNGRGSEEAMDQQENAILRERLAPGGEGQTNLEAAEMATAAVTKEAQRKDEQLLSERSQIEQLMSERSQIDKKFHDMMLDLITRLQSACAQQDEARGRVLELENSDTKLSESLQENAILRERLVSGEDQTNRKAAEMATALKKAQDDIGQLMSERSQIDKEFNEMKTDLTTRLQNACAQRDEARGRVLELENENTKLSESLQVARRQLGTLRQQPCEGTKLLEDKKTLEQKVHELQAMLLETVQGQRNELRQQVKEELAARAEVEREMEVLRAELEVVNRGRLEETQQLSAALQQEKEALKQENAILRERLVSGEDQANRKAAEMATALKKAQDDIGQLMSERSQIDKKFHEMKTDLITRLQNACAQRDEARGRVLELENENTKLTESLQVKGRELAAANAAAAAVQVPASVATAAASPGPVGTPVAHPATAMQNMFQKLQASAPGYARNVADNISGLFAKEGTQMRTPPRAGITVGEDDMRPPSLSSIPGSAGASPESEADRRMREAQMKQVTMLAEKRKAEEDRLLAALTAPLPTSSSGKQQDGAGPLGMGFYKGRPVAAIVIFRYCLHSRAFQADRTTIFDRIVSVIGQQVERGQEDNNCLSYWLSNTVTLLHMLNKNVKPASGSMNKARGGVTAAGVGAATRSVLGAMFGSRSGASPGSLSHTEASIHGGGVGGFKQVEAKYPALLFKQQLDAFVQKIYPMIRDNVRKEISPMLNNCIHTPKASGRTAARPGAAAPAGGDKAAGAASAAQQAASHKSWTDILHVLDTLLAVVKANNVPKVLVQALFKQLFRFINAKLFNQLMLRRECCSFSNGEYVKTGLEQVAHWINGAGADYMADSWEELEYLRQAVTFLVTANKPKKTLEEITSDLFPVLSIQQLYRISTMYRDDKYNTETVSLEVLSRMKQAMADSNSAASYYFLLDDDSSLPFQAAELLANMDDKDLYGGIPVPEVLQYGDGAASFAFLEKELRFAAPTTAQ